MKKLLVIPVLSLLLLPLCKTDNSKQYTVAVSFIIGEVKKNGTAVAIGDQISENDIITTAANSSCDVKMGGSLLRVKENSTMKFSQLSFKPASENMVLGLDSGKILCKPKKLLKDDSFTVKTPTAVAAVRGTQFTVETDVNKTTRINVFEGKVKVAKRVESLESAMEKIIEATPAVNKNESVIITLEDKEKAEKIAREEVSRTGDVTVAAEKSAAEIVVTKNDIKPFTVEQFASDTSDTIIVKEKPAAVVKEIKKEIEKTQVAKTSDSRAYLTKHDIYLIKNGKVDFEGELSSDPVQIGKSIFAPTPSRVFAISETGNLLWDSQMINDGKLLVENGKLFISINGQKKELDLKNGKVK